MRVSDQGVGIVASDLPHVFDRFYQTSKSRNKKTGGGYGLGLAIAKKIVEAHNGNISVEKSSPKGTVFLVELSA